MTLEADALEAARYGFHRRFPRHSAKRALHATQAVVMIGLVAALIWALRESASATLRALHIAALALFAAATSWRLIAAASLAFPLSRLAAPNQWPIYTILCPLYREANVVHDLVAALDRLDYPKHRLDIKLLVEGDDLDTLAAALTTAEPAHIDVVIVPAAIPRTKPKALNVGLALARGDYVAVYDAEDRPHPQQLRAALAAFEDGGERLACVQAPLAIDNGGESWIARQFATEYAIQFREILPLLARLGMPLPLGGSSNHFRAHALRESGGWDPYNVTEDADLGYRLARGRWRAGVIEPPTWEEAPVRFSAWLDQRTRWIKGHVQTWLVLMRNPVRAAREMGLAAFMSMQLVLGLGIVAAFAHGPLALFVLAAVVSPDDLLGPADFILALAGYCVAVFTTLTAAALSRDLSLVRAAATMPLYWPLASIAAARALFELVLRPHHWAKTAHGVSRRAAAPTARPRTDAAAQPAEPSRASGLSPG